MNELLIYGDINSWTSAEFIRGFAEIMEGPLTVRVNSGGGSPIYGLGMINKFREFQGDRFVKVDGVAHSTAGFFVLFAKETEGIKQSKYVIHRAAYPDYYEQNYMTEDEKTRLAEFNQDMYEAYKVKLDVPKFEQISGKKLKDIFSMDSRIEVQLNAKQAKQVGLINKIVDLTPEMHSDIKMRVERVNIDIAANSGSAFIPELEMSEEDPIISEPKTVKTVKMNIEELQAKHPEVYAQVIAKGVTQGQAEERDRVSAWMAWQEIDAVRVKEGIESGKMVSMSDMSEFNVTAMKNGYLGTLKTEAEKTAATKDGSTAVVETVAEVDANQKQIDDLTASILGKKPEIK